VTPPGCEGFQRAMSELIAHGSFRILDLSPFRYERIPRNEPFLEED
jgi:hypothetical protein